LTREYGWSAFGVYLLLVALDFPFCFAAVRYLGTDRIGHYEHVVVEWIKSAIPESVVGKFREWRERLRRKEDEAEMGMVTIGGVAGEERRVEAYGEVKDGVAEVVGFDHGVKEAEEANGSDNASECPARPLETDGYMRRVVADKSSGRHMDAISFGIRHP